ncbi:Uncharacterized protein Adt_48455 [Abeliophyllum distichum]|uniref:Uncharacterized protein n=1 Tax=Abeliophyllum distichum TaxID=126358 RepID=A0ABD1NTY8_9LAMI
MLRYQINVNGTLECRSRWNWDPMSLGIGNDPVVERWGPQPTPKRVPTQRKSNENMPCQFDHPVKRAPSHQAPLSSKKQNTHCAKNPFSSFFFWWNIRRHRNGIYLTANFVAGEFKFQAITHYIVVCVILLVALFVWAES